MYFVREILLFNTYLCFFSKYINNEGVIKSLFVQTERYED